MERDPWGKEYSGVPGRLSCGDRGKGLVVSEVPFFPRGVGGNGVAEARTVGLSALSVGGRGRGRGGGRGGGSDAEGKADSE